MSDLFHQHRSVRKYKTDSIASELITDILNAGSRASNTGNMQAYCMVTTQDFNLREALWEVHFKQEMVLKAPLHITFCADFNRMSQWCIQRGAQPGFDNFLSFMAAATDAILASQNVVLAAEAHGLGACYLGTAVYNADKIIEILKLPKLVIPVAAIVIGYPEVIPPLTDRLPLEAVVHTETYQPFTRENIDQLYAEKENLEFYKKLPEINQVESLAHVFTEKRYTLQDNVFFSGRYLNVLKAQGFLE